MPDFVNPQITDAITQTNVQILGTAPGTAMGNLFQAISDSAAHAVLAAAWADGCRSFDTAPHYGQGLSEHRVGRLLEIAAEEGRDDEPDDRA